MSEYFPKVRQWRLPAEAFETSVAEMRGDGADGNEGIALWLGRREEVATVTQLALLRGPGILRLPFELTISAALIDLVTEYAVDEGLTLVGQIHSHGPLAGVDLSPTDRRHGFVVPDFLSLVAPNFAMDSNLLLQECGIHVYENAQGWRRLPAGEAQARVRVSHDGLEKVVAIGGLRDE